MQQQRMVERVLPDHEILPGRRTAIRGRCQVDIGATHPIDSVDRHAIGNDREILRGEEELFRGDRSQHLTITERSLRLGHRDYAEEPYRFIEPGRQRLRLERILATDPDLAHAWELYQALHRIYLADGEDQANEALGEFLDAHYTRTLPEFEPLLDTLLAWGDEIFAFHDTDRATNGRLEGTNAKLGVLKRIAYGFVSATDFGRRALLLAPGVAS